MFLTLQYFSCDSLSSVFLACSDALGVADPSIISDAQINASSSLSTQYNGSHVRLDDTDGWIAGVSDNSQYVIFDMAALPRVTGVSSFNVPQPGKPRILDLDRGAQPFLTQVTTLPRSTNINCHSVT